MATALALPCITWERFPCGLLQGDVQCRIGDCFFACLAVWLNVVHERTVFDARLLRMVLKCAMAWPEVEPVMPVLLNDMEIELQLAENSLTLLEAQRLVLLPSTWAQHPHMIVMAHALTRILQRPTGFVVTKLDAGARGGGQPWVCELAPYGTERYEMACALHHVNGNHYRLLAAHTGACIYDPTVCGMRRRLEDVGLSRSASEAVSEAEASDSDPGDASQRGSPRSSAWSRRRGRSWGSAESDRTARSARSRRSGSVERHVELEDWHMTFG